MEQTTNEAKPTGAASAVERRVGRNRVRTVEYEPGFGWIARDPNGHEVWPDFRWASRSVARDVARQAKMAHNVELMGDGQAQLDRSPSRMKGSASPSLED